MVYIRNFERNDIGFLRRMFDGRSDEEIYSILDEWNGLEQGGRYFEMFAVCSESETVGFVSLYQHSGYVVSAGPEIFPEHRRKGYAFEAMRLAYEYAKNRGYKIASAQIRKDNTASIKLHEKLGFMANSEMVNRHGNEVYIYLKLL